jgi:hypothetical protein
MQQNELLFFLADPLPEKQLLPKNKNGEKKWIVECSFISKCDIQVSSRIICTGGKLEEYYPAQPVAKWFALRLDPRVRKIFQIIQHDFDSWKGICNIIEIMQEDNFSYVLKGIKYRDAVKNIKQTAQSFEAIGTNARHSHSRFSAPDNPISFKAGQKIVHELVLLWLAEKEKNLN